MDEIEAFWLAFRRDEDELSKQNPDPDAMDRTLAALRGVDRRLYFYVGCKYDSADLIISAEGKPDLMPVASRIMDLAPKLDGWGFLRVFDGLALFGERNSSLYPDSASGDALYRKVQDGDKPWIPRPVDFNVVFPTEASAITFSKHLARNGIESKVSAYDGAEGYTHDVHVAKEMTPTLEEIEKFEGFLDSLARELGGRNDGWGCFSV